MSQALTQGSFREPRQRPVLGSATKFLAGNPKSTQQERLRLAQISTDEFCPQVLSVSGSADRSTRKAGISPPKSLGCAPGAVTDRRSPRFPLFADHQPRNRALTRGTEGFSNFDPGNLLSFERCGFLYSHRRCQCAYHLPSRASLFGCASQNPGGTRIDSRGCRVRPSPPLPRREPE